MSDAPGRAMSDAIQTGQAWRVRFDYTPPDKSWPQGRTEIVVANTVEDAAAYVRTMYLDGRVSIWGAQHIGLAHLVPPGWVKP